MKFVTGAYMPKGRLGMPLALQGIGGSLSFQRIARFGRSWKVVGMGEGLSGEGLLAWAFEGGQSRV